VAVQVVAERVELGDEVAPLRYAKIRLATFDWSATRSGATTPSGR
jgi:hypothetical protein